MTTSYQAFRDSKEKINNKRKEEFSELTLRYFNMITEMLEREEDYGDSFPFLESVYNYISLHEYISPKQQEIVDRIQENPQSSWSDEYDGDLQPF